MPVRFSCPTCQIVLGIADRKIGCQITCPKCGEALIVPSHQEAAVWLTSAAIGGGAHPAARLPNDVSGPPDEGHGLADFGEVPRLITDVEENQHRAAAAVRAWPPAGPSSNPAGPTASAPPARTQFPPSGLGRSGEGGGVVIPSGFVLVSRRAVYAQAVLALALALFAFLAGYAIGRGFAPQRDSAGGGGDQAPLVIEGSVAYTPVPSTLEADDESTILVVPAGGKFVPPLAVAGFRPDDPLERRSPSLDLLREQGGDFARTDSSGGFQLVLPAAGDYHLLVLSKHALQQGGQVRGPTAADQAEMAPYFSSPEQLVGIHRYRWTRHHFNTNSPVLAIEFE